MDLISLHKLITLGYMELDVAMHNGNGGYLQYSGMSSR